MNGEFTSGVDRAIRYHAFDALRAAMMLLGLVLHAGASYTYQPLRDAWPFHDPPGHVAFDITLFLIHVFRMPTFFVVAGFFGALLYGRDGTRGFIRNRGTRVGLPLLVFLLTALPLAGLGFLFAARREGLASPISFAPSLPPWRQPILGHLWFLYDLLIFYAASLLVVPIAARVPPGLRQRAHRAVGRLAGRPLGALALGLVTTLTLLPMAVPGLETSAAIAPPFRVLLAYGTFFAFGWCLHREHETLVPAFGRTWRGNLLVGTVLIFAYLVVLMAKERMQAQTWHVIAVVLAGPATWLVIFGLLGLFVRHLNAPRPGVRYLSDASYWMYVTHLAPITWTAGLLAPFSVPGAAKFAIVLAVTTAITLATYHWWVRFTRLGVLLNGRRALRPV